MNERDSAASTFREQDADDRMIADGTALTSDRADALGRLAEEEPLSADDHANLSGLANEMEQYLRNLVGRGIPEEDRIEYSIEEMERLSAFHHRAESGPGPDDAGSWELAVSLLQQNNAAYDTPAVVGLAERLETRAISDETAAESARDTAQATGATNDRSAMLAERGYAEEDIARVNAVLDQPAGPIGRAADATNDIERRESLVAEGRGLDGNRVRLVRAYAVRAEMDDLAGATDDAQQSRTRMRQHAAEVDVSSVGLVDLEETALQLAGSPANRQESDIISKMAGAAAERAGDAVRECDEALRAGDINMATVGERTGGQRRSALSADLERGLTMSGIAAAYGSESAAEPALLQYRSSGASGVWDREYDQTMQDLREGGAAIADRNFQARAAARREEAAQS